MHLRVAKLVLLQRHLPLQLHLNHNPLVCSFPVWSDTAESKCHPLTPLCSFLCHTGNAVETRWYFMCCCHCFFYCWMVFFFFCYLFDHRHIQCISKLAIRFVWFTSKAGLCQIFQGNIQRAFNARCGFEIQHFQRFRIWWFVVAHTFAVVRVLFFITQVLHWHRHSQQRPTFYERIVQLIVCVYYLETFA